MSSSLDLDALTAEQRSTLEQYTAVTNQELKDAIPILGRAQWNLQIAITRFFDGEPTTDPVAEAMAAAQQPADIRRAETLMNGFSTSSSSRAAQQHGLESAPRVVPQPDNQTNRTLRPPLLLQILFSPLTILQAVLARSFSFLGWLFPFLPRLLGRLTGPTGLQSQRGSPNSGRRPLKPRDTAARFIREFEEEYGSNPLPFNEDGYAQSLDAAKRDLKFLLVLLISPEHDDTTAYIRETLLAPNVVSFLTNPENNLVLWAGNIRDSEPYQVATALNVTKFPFAALIAHTPSVSSTAMSVVARLTGPLPPATFSGKLQTAIDRHAPGLVSARRAKQEQQATRDLREQQNSAYERSLAVDRERSRKKREEEEKRKRDEDEENKRRDQAERYEQDLQAWRSWRAGRIHPEPGAEVKDAVRISVRLLGGDRVIRKFEPSAPIEELYAYVECYDIIQEGRPDGSPTAAPNGFKHDYNFRLVSPMPREVIAVEAGGTLRERIGRSGNLIVEKVTSDESSDEDDDNDKSG